MWLGVGQMLQNLIAVEHINRLFLLLEESSREKCSRHNDIHQSFRQDELKEVYEISCIQMGIGLVIIFSPTLLRSRFQQRYQI